MLATNIVKRLISFPITRHFSATTKHFSKNVNVALVLSGCGVYDGSEIHEASSCLVHLSRHGAKVSMFAPDMPQKHTINHLTGDIDDSSKRNVLQESARIARGKVENIRNLKSSDFQCIVLPGGFGAAKHLSTLAFDGPNLTVEPTLEKVLKAFHSEQKPIAMCCIAPVIAAKVFKDCEVTLGHEESEGGKWPHHEAVGAVKAVGAKHIVKDVTDIHVDAANKIVTSPAFMCETALHEIHDGIGKMIDAALDLAPKA